MISCAFSSVTVDFALMLISANALDITKNEHNTIGKMIFLFIFHALFVAQPL